MSFMFQFAIYFTFAGSLVDFESSLIEIFFILFVINPFWRSISGFTPIKGRDLSPTLFSQQI